MIKSLRIQNFQNHKDTTLEFSPGFNVIMGKTEAGKSAIIRSIEWLRNNRPSGNSFMSGEKTIVTLKVDDYIIKKVKADKRNEYKINDVVYKAVGQSVPGDIVDILRMTDLNFQFQHDRYFLIPLSAGEVARYLNQIVQLDEIDVSIQNINKTYREEVNSLAHFEMRIKELEEELKQYDWIPIAEEKAKRLKSLEEKINILEQEKEELFEIIDRIEELEEEKAQFKETKKQERKLASLFETAETIEDLSEKCNELILILEEIESKKREFDENEKNIKIEEKRFKELFPNICPLCGERTKDE